MLILNNFSLINTINNQKHLFLNEQLVTEEDINQANILIETVFNYDRKESFYYLQLFYYQHTSKYGEIMTQ